MKIYFKYEGDIQMVLEKKKSWEYLAISRPVKQETLEELFRLKENDPRCLQDRHFIKYKDVDWQ